MKYLLAIVLLAGFFSTPAFAQDVNNPSVIIDTIEIPTLSIEKRNGREIFIIFKKDGH